MRWRTGLLTAPLAATAFGCSMGDINPGGPDTRVGLTTTQVVGTWTVAQGSGSVAFEQDGTFTATGLPASALGESLHGSAGPVDGTGTWTLGPNHGQGDDLQGLVDLGFRTINGSDDAIDMPLAAHCDGVNFFLEFGNTGLIKSGLTCTLD